MAALTACSQDEAPIYCHEFEAGQEVTLGLLGSPDESNARTLATLRVAADLDAIVETANLELGSVCRRLAPADVSSADAIGDPAKRTAALCALASLQGPRPAAAVCTQSITDRSDCLLTCAGCDVACDMEARAKAKCVAADTSDLSSIVAIQARLASIIEAKDAFFVASYDAANHVRGMCFTVVLESVARALLIASAALETANELLDHLQ